MPDSLTPKQQRFVDQYLIDCNATQAAVRAGYDLPLCSNPSGYYVYLLTDSRTQEIFYIGKGKGQRYRQHVREWSTSLRGANQLKCQRIGDIIRSGGSVVALCFADGLSEDDAYTLERLMIASIGPNLLTNLTPGQLTEHERSAMYATELLARVIPFPQWTQRRHRTSDDCDMYWYVIKGLQQVSSRPNG